MTMPALAALMSDLGGHCMESLVEAFDAAQDDVPTLFVAWTVKGFGLPFAGHKDNHAGLMNPTQMAALRDSMGITEGDEWKPLAGIGDNARAGVEAAIERSKVIARTSARAPSARSKSRAIPLHKATNNRPRRRSDGSCSTSPSPDIRSPTGSSRPRQTSPSRPTSAPGSTSAACSSAVTWPTSLRRQRLRRHKNGRPAIGASISSWASPRINLFLDARRPWPGRRPFGERLVPIGTLYDPFIARGLDALNYACYQDARFLLVATPSGITLGPEGGAHQSINPPLIALGQPGLRHYEPAFADELAAMMQEAFRLIDAPDGESTYLRLSTRAIAQVRRPDEAWKEGALAGGYWLREPGPGAEAAIVAMGAVMPEAIAAHEELSTDIPGLGLLAITSPDLLHRGWTAAQAERWQGKREPSHIEGLLSRLAPDAGLVTLADAAPASLSWLGGVLGQRVAPLGVDRFGQTGSLPDLYAAYRLDGGAITEAAAEILLRNGYSNRS